MAKRNEPFSNPFETVNRAIKVAKVARALSGPKMTAIRTEVRDFGGNNIVWAGIAQIAGVHPLSDRSREAVRLQLQLEDTLSD